jgi:hypothetical protein
MAFRWEGEDRPLLSPKVDAMLGGRKLETSTDGGSSSSSSGSSSFRLDARQRIDWTKCIRFQGVENVNFRNTNP